MFVLGKPLLSGLLVICNASSLYYAKAQITNYWTQVEMVTRDKHSSLLARKFMRKRKKGS